jgi:pyruvate kinase
VRRTKIVCTLGPAVDDEKILRELFILGMDVARMNFSHGNHEEHKKRADQFKKIREELQRPVPLILDTKGPEIRIGKFKDGEAHLMKGDEFALYFDEILGDQEKVSMSYKSLYQDVKKGTRILINDGLIELEVFDIKNKNIHCLVLNGGIIGNNKGVNVPNVKINLPSVFEKDVEDIKFGIENGFDFIAASFVRKAADVIQIKKVLEKYRGKDIKVIAKIENREGIENIDEIIKVSDGIMVARGDLGVEIPVEEVPLVQKVLIGKCYNAGKPVITATQMLDSMIRNPRPTRAEASDVANAIYDGTSAIMLSGEIAAGKYPLESLQTMSKIAETTEKSINYWEKFVTGQYYNLENVTNAISHATCTTSFDLKAAAIITVTHTGNTARMISKFRPPCPILANTVNPRVQRQLSLSWGVIPFLVKEVSSTDEMFDVGVENAQRSRYVKNGDLVVITAGIPVGISGTTNILKVHIVGNILVRGKGIGQGLVTGQVRVAMTPKEACESIAEGEILVVPYTNDEMLPAIKKCAGLVVEGSDLDYHAITVALALDIPVIVGAENAVKILKSSAVVTLDVERGILSAGNGKVKTK